MNIKYPIAKTTDVTKRNLKPFLNESKNELPPPIKPIKVETKKKSKIIAAIR